MRDRLPSGGPVDDADGYHGMLPHLQELMSIAPGLDDVQRYAIHRWGRRNYGWQCGHDNPCNCDCACCRRRKGLTAP